MQLKIKQFGLCIGLTSGLLLSGITMAHDPVFSPGPHLLFKDGFEVHAEFFQAGQGNEKESGQAIAIKYGLSSDWVTDKESLKFSEPQLIILFNDSGFTYRTMKKLSDNEIDSK